MLDKFSDEQKKTIAENISYLLESLEGKRWRGLTEREKHVDFVAIEGFYNRSEKEVEKELKPVMKKQVDKLVKRLKKADGLSDIEEEEFSESQYEKIFEKHFFEAIKEGNKTTAKELKVEPVSEKEIKRLAKAKSIMFARKVTRDLHFRVVNKFLNLKARKIMKNEDFDI